MKRPPIHGLMAEFENPTDLVHAARSTYAAGYRRINGYSPFSIEELSEAIGFHQEEKLLECDVRGIVFDQV